MKIVFRLYFNVLLIALMLFLSTNTYAEDNGQVVDHPGTTDLVYFGVQPRDPPLSPLHKVRVNNKFFYVLPNVVLPSIQKTAVYPLLF